MDKIECCRCQFLEMEEGRVPANWATNKYYTCSKGRYGGVLQWFAWSGIVKPNKTVAKAQRDCPYFKRSPTP